MAAGVPEKLVSIVREAFDQMAQSTEGFGSAAACVPETFESASAALGIASEIPFQGEGLNGALIFGGERGLLARSHPGNASWINLGDAQIADWTGEITNQVLGRIKNRLAEIDIHFTMGTPVALKEGAKALGPSDTEKVCFRLNTDSGACATVFCVKIVGSLDFGKDASGGGAEAGDALLF